MKKTFLILWVLIQVLPFSGLPQKSIKPALPVKIKVYYFHTDERCPIDQSVETNTKNVMQANFQEKINKGEIDFRIINTDDKANTKLVSNFEINAQALYIVEIERDKEIKHDLTRFAFDNAFSNPLKFKKGLKDEIGKILQ